MECGKKVRKCRVLHQNAKAKGVILQCFQGRCQDLKSCAHRERAGSSPAPGTRSSAKCKVRSVIFYTLHLRLYT